MSFEYFTYPGNGEVVQTVLTAVATLSGSDTMTSAAQAAALFGFIVMLAIAVYKIDLKDAFTTIIVIAILWGGVMVPKTDVLITEGNGYGFLGRQYAVSNVPLGLALLGHLASSFGFNITRKMESLYSLPDDLNYSKTGVLFGSNLLEAIGSSKISDPVLTQDWALFMNQCSFFDINMYHLYSINDVRMSQDLIGTLQNTNKAMFTNVTDLEAASSGSLRYKSTSTTTTCDRAAAVLSSRTNRVLKSSVTPYIANKVFGTVKLNGLDNTTALANLGNSSFQYLMKNSSFDTLKNIEQVAMTNMIRTAGVINGQRNNNSALIQQSFAQAQARNQYIESQKTGAWMASWNLPLIRSTAEAILIGLFPLVILFALMTGAMAFGLLRFYLTGLFWLQMWAPVASIINLVMTIHARTLFSSQATGGIIAAGNLDSLLMAAADAQAAAGGAMWLIPVISGALVMGGSKLIDSFAGMASGARSGAEAAGSAVGRGDFSGGNINYHNANANKTSMDPVYSDPQTMTTTGAGGTGWMKFDTGTARVQTRNSSLAVSSQSQISESQSYNMAAERSVTAARQQQAVYQESLAQGQSQTLAWIGKHSTGQGAESGYGIGADASQAQKWSQAMKVADDISQKHGISETSAIRSQLASQLGLNAPVDPVIKLGGSWSGAASNESKLSSDIVKAAKALREEGIMFDSNFTDKVSSSAAFKQSLASGDELAQSASTSMQRAQQASRSATDSFNEAQYHREQAARTYGDGGTVTYDNTNDVIENNPNLTMAELNSGAGNTFQTAIATANRGAERMDVAARDAGWKPESNLTPDSRPHNTVDSSHQKNMATVSSGSAAAFADVRDRAAQHGIRADSVDAAIRASGRDYERDFNQGRQTVNGNIEQGSQRYDARVDDLAARAHKADETSNGTMMELNSHINLGNRRGERREQVMQDVRNGKGNMGSGSDQVEANLGRNPNLANDLKQRPGSGSKTFRPKQ